MKKILILNGVNLGTLGTREVDIYGYQSFNDYFKHLKLRFQQLELYYFQTDQLGDLVEHILKAKDFDGVVINPGAFTHTAIVIADAIKAIKTPVVEVHISNLFAREQFRRNSMIGSSCVGSISGFGMKSYELALNYFV